MEIFKIRRCLAFCLLGIPLLSAEVKNPSQEVQISTVSESGMPKDIVPKGANWNFGPGAILTHGDWQYAAFWDDMRQVSIARRELPSGKWESASLDGYVRTKDTDRGKGGSVSRGFGDSHEKVAMGISSDGFIHLAFDHHVSTLHYRSSKKPIAADPTSYQWKPDLFGPVRDNLGGAAIDRVTYPTFTNDGDRLALYLRLNGGSGSADSHMFEYQNGHWTVDEPEKSIFIAKTWSGGNGTVNAYPQEMVVREGRRYLTWCWRDTPDPKSSHDLCFAYSDDHGETWLNNYGKTIGKRGTRPITADSSDVVAWKIPAGSKFSNGGSMDVGPDGCVYVLIRGETGRTNLYKRDPKTEKWSCQEALHTGLVRVGSTGLLHIVSEDGLQANFPDGSSRQIANGNSALFADSKMAMDRTRNDGWLSVIGQQGKTISVIDYPMENRMR